MAIKTFILENHPEKEARHAAVQKAVQEFLEDPAVRVVYDAKGKPTVEDAKQPRFISITTTGAVMLCVLSDTPVGIDGERLDRFGPDTKTDYIALAERFFSEDEADYVREGGEGEALRFVRVWVRKEAYVKLTGKGLVDFPNFSVIEGEKFSSKVNGVPLKRFNINFPESSEYLFAIAGLD